MRLAFFAGLSLLASSLVCYADTLASFTIGNHSVVVPNYLGEAFTVSGSGAYSSIAFDFVSNGTAYAPGTGFLLSQPFSGSPTQLSSATSGFLGQSVGSAGFYNFDPSVILQTGVTYYLFENTLVPAFSVPGGLTTGSSPEYFEATSGGYFTGQSGASADFSVTGSPYTQATSVTPEPSSLVLVGTGLVSLLGAARRRYV